MSRRWLFILGAPLLTAAALLLSTSSALARGHGGGHAGHGGGGHGGAWGGGWHGGGWGGGYYHRGWGGYPGLWWGSYGYYPYSNYYYSDYWPGYYTSDYQPDYYYTSPESGYQSFYPSDLGNNQQNVARINVQVPANAEIFVDGVKTSQTGPFREFVSPALKPGSNYTYEIRAKWTQSGQTMDRTKTVPIHAGDVANVNFMQAAASNAQQPAPANATEQTPPNNNLPASPTQPNKVPSATNPPLPTAPPRK
jgi:uncharacterized protein (TIGR03000 family)